MTTTQFSIAVQLGDESAIWAVGLSDGHPPTLLLGGLSILLASDVADPPGVADRLLRSVSQWAMEIHRRSAEGGAL